MRFQFSVTPQKHSFGCACVFCLPGLSGLGSQGFGCTLSGCGAPFPSTVPVCTGGVPAACVCSQELDSSCDPPESQEGLRPIQNLRKSLDRNRGPVCSVGGGGFSGAEFAPFPSPLPPTSSGDGPVHCRLALLWSFSVPLFCEQPAVCSGWLIFSLAIPQFKRAPSNCSQGLWARSLP